MKRIIEVFLVAIFLAAIVAANLTLTHWGPSAIIPNAFFLIGLDLITRDRLADLWGTTRWAKMLVLIAAGGALSYWLNRHAATIAEASIIAFAAAELAEAVLYHVLRHQRWVERAYVREAKRRGKWVHMGRVNSRKRIFYAASLGCDSVDGSKYARWRKTHLDVGLGDVLDATNYYSPIWTNGNGMASCRLT